MSKIKKVYDKRYSSNYRESLSGYEIARWEALNHFITHILAIDNTNKVLDYGAGSGLHVALWEKVFTKSKLHFCDISSTTREKFVTKFKRYIDSYQLVYDNRAYYDNSSFDVIVSIEVMEHVEDLNAYLQDIYRLLKPGGRFIWTTPCANKYSIEHIIAFLSGKIEATGEGYRRWCFEDPTHLRRLKSREIKSVLEDHSFDEVLFRFRAHFFSYVCTEYLPRRKFTKLKNKLMTLDYSFFRELPNGASMIGSARKWAKKAVHGKAERSAVDTR